MHGQPVDMPGRYPVAIAVMKEMSWSWSDLCAAPADLVEEVLHRMNRSEHWERERARMDKQREQQRNAHGR